MPAASAGITAAKHDRNLKFFKPDLVNGANSGLLSSLERFRFSRVCAPQALPAAELV
jgi:hypothetical protein